MQELLITIVKGLVENPDAVSVTVDEVDERGIVVYHLHVAGIPAHHHFSLYPDGRHSHRFH